MPNNEMDYSLIHRTPDGNGKILVTTPGSPDKGSWETEAELKTYVNQDTVMKTDIVQSLGQQVDKVPSNKAVDDAINAINTSFIPFKLGLCTDLDANRIVSEADYRTVHFYYFTGHATGTKPFADGYLIEFSWAYNDGRYTTQIALEDVGQQIAMRSKQADLTWETWKFFTLT